jgi:hypothetical protein
MGDRRLSARLMHVVDACCAAPEKSFNEGAGTPSELTATYRFIENEAVTAAAILAPHFVRTVGRCAEAATVLVVHDTTELKFSGETERRGLGRLRGADQGFLLHCSLAVAGDGTRRPLGLLHAHTWTRDSLGRSRNKQGRRLAGSEYHKIADKESNRWWAGVQAVDVQLKPLRPVHVMDREGDAFALLWQMHLDDLRFIVRMARDRTLVDEDGERIAKTSESLAYLETVFELEVPLSRRANKTIPKAQGARDSRLAKLAISATRANLLQPYTRNGEVLPCNIVHVQERNTPSDVEPVAWVLLTTEPIETIDQLRFILESYRARWLIEELFKALKTGCAFEKRELESYDTLTNSLAIYLPIAWQMLLLRNRAQNAPDEPAESILSPVQIAILRATIPKLKPRLTAVDALYAVAYLAGHFFKKPPGWQRLAWGFERLLDIEIGWKARESLGEM